MKPFVSLVILACTMLAGTLAVADCTVKRNTNIILTKPSSTYSDHGDGTVTDKQTGLMWQKCSLGLAGSVCSDPVAGVVQKYTWHAALLAANNFTDDKYSDWRLPNKNELDSLVEDACINLAINGSLFPGTIAGVYWTSSPFTLYTGSAWGIHFGVGFVVNYIKNTTNYVRLVRDSLSLVP